ncbi:MAG: L-threonylcarbamoyladenylate synthase [Aquificaceae bacterium]|nr:L-threonylcarbamoyladenylate synthase [Aquificaceae bacterium]
MKVKKLTRTVLEDVADVLSNGGIVCFPTDTIYGLLADASNGEAVERLYSIRRPSGRPFLLLIPNVAWLRDLGLMFTERHEALVQTYPATFIFYKWNRLPLFLTRSGKSLAVRKPKAQSHVFELLKILNVPLVAPSANPEGEKPATTVKEAMQYFGDKVDLYIDGGAKKGKPSTIVRLMYPKGIRLVREGNIQFKYIFDFYTNFKPISFSLPAVALSEFFSLDPFEIDLPFLPPR